MHLQTKRNRPVFAAEVQGALDRIVEEVCQHADYHILARQIQPNKLELLLSLKPTDAISRAIACIKANTARLLFAQHPTIVEILERRHLWAASYRAETVGKATSAAIKAYVDFQRTHHLVTQQTARRLSLYSAPDKESYLQPRRARHAIHLLNYHFVFSVKRGQPVVNEALAQYLQPLWLRICEEKGFGLLTLDILDDHAHCLLALKPQIAPQTAAEVLMNNSCYLALRRFPRLAQACTRGQLWTPGFFVRSVGNRTTAQVKSFLVG
jgi:putative transposase